MSNFQKYPTFIGKINCFYLATNEYFDKASALDKIEQRSDKIEKMKQFLETKDINLADFSGVTSSNTFEAPNFITESFFLVHILISYMTQKIEKLYEKNHQQIN